MPPREYIELKPGRCWWCGAPADSREHKMKRSDIVREDGKPPYTGLRTLTRFSAGGRQDFTGPNSPLMKFGTSLCARCNNERSQPFDAAWDALTEHVAKNEERLDLPKAEAARGRLPSERELDAAATSSRVSATRPASRLRSRCAKPARPASAT
jgi:hypothetical protein